MTPDEAQDLRDRVDGLEARLDLFVVEMREFMAKMNGTTLFSDRPHLQREVIALRERLKEILDRQAKPKRWWRR